MQSSQELDCSSEGYFKSSDGLNLYYRRHETSHARFQLLLLHGLGEHSGRYQWFANQVALEGGEICCLDLRGHGKSEGSRGHAPSYEQLLKDIASFIQNQRNTQSKMLPLFLMGHSLGGGLVLNYALNEQSFLHNQEDKLQGVIALSPLLRLSFTPPAWKIYLARKLVKMFPSFSLDRGIRPRVLSRDPAILAEHKIDPLNHEKVSAALTLGFLDMGEQAIAKAGELEIPALLLHGEADQVTSIEASRDFANAAGKQVEFIGFANCFHELLNEPRTDREAVSRGVLQWINQQLAH